MSLQKSALRYEIIGTDPFNFTTHKCNLGTLKKAQIERLKKSPNIIEPVTAEIIRDLYRLYRLFFQVVFWCLSYIDAKFAELAGV